MPYPGNANLAPDAQERIIRTFRQTLELSAEGSRQEAILGCDFILRMDPAFEPARVLMGRLGGTVSGSIPTEDLERWLTDGPPAGTAPAKPAAKEEQGLDFDPFDLDAELPDLPSLHGGPKLSALAAGLQDLFAKGDLKRLIQVAEENRHEVAADADARRTVEQAYHRLEAEPYVKSFAEKARRALADGQQAEAEKLLAKARSLDASHPELLELEAQISGSTRKPATAQPPAPGGWAAFPEPGSDGVSFDPGLAANADFIPPFGGEPAGAGESDERIRQLLVEGQQAFSRGDLQAAIDAWSRIFLIDIDHPEAARRIEEARRLKAESERKVEELFHEAVAAFDRGEREVARQGFERVLAVAPSYFAAREYLAQLNASSGEPEASHTASPYFGSAPDLTEEDQFLRGDIFEAPDLSEELSIPPPTAHRTGSRAAETLVPPPPRPAAQPAPSKARGGRFAVIGGGVLALLLVGGFLAWQQRGRLFPNAESTVAEGDLVAQAKALHDSGKGAAALNALRRVPKSSPGYAEAQRLIAAWQQEKKTPSGASQIASSFHLQPIPTAAAPPSDPVVLERWQREVDRGQDAFGAQEYLRADAYFRRAAEIAPLAGPAADLAKDALKRLAPLEPQIGLFREGKWEQLLPDLERLAAEQSDNRDLKRLLADTHFNLAVKDLKDGNATSALRRLDASLALAPESTAARRHRAFAQAYADQPVDLAYQIYTKYLPYR
ncbi:MAG: hypothetical protein U0002_02985 [Thermoanaerobaculia bacterium]